MTTLVAELWVPRAPEEVFPFFADARNLEAITPPWLRFGIASPLPITMRKGAVIDYRLRVHGMPLRWRSEITRWEPPYAFCDEQRRGPYRRWVHTHTFAPADGGTLCTDRVEYSVWGGAWIERLFVRRDVATIFEYRQSALHRQFGGTSTGEAAGRRPWRVRIRREERLPEALRAGNPV